jgi:hypothetical protein
LIFTLDCYFGQQASRVSNMHYSEVSCRLLFRHSVDWQIVDPQEMIKLLDSQLELACITLDEIASRG